MNKEILLIVDSLANEKGVKKEKIFAAIEKAQAIITGKRYRPEADMRVSIDRKTGDYETFRRWTVVKEADLIDSAKEIVLEKALKINPDLEVGDIVEEQVESIKFGRIEAQQARQIIMHEISYAERDDIARKYHERINTMVSGVAKKVFRDGIILDLGDNVEALLPKKETLPRESIRIGDRIRGILYEAHAERRGLVLLVSRTRPEFLVELFRAEVPEIAEEIIEIKAVARDPGFRAKMAVKTNDGRIDPIGACVGIRGSRVQAVSNELSGERVDIILWDGDPVQLVINAMSPAEIASIVVDEEKKSMDVAVREDQLAQAIGKSGQNVRLVSELTGWRLNVSSVTEAETKTREETENTVKLFTEGLDVDEDLAKGLVEQGFRSLEDISSSPLEEFTEIEGVDEGIAKTLRDRARDALLEQALSGSGNIGTKEPAKDLLEMEGMTRHLAYVLASHGIITREDLAELAVDDLADIEEISEEEAAKLIMTARIPWFEEEEKEKKEDK
jgi:transcription termination/antitermination protein NusA